MEDTVKRSLFDAGPVQWAGTLIALQLLATAVAQSSRLSLLSELAAAVCLAAWLAYPIWVTSYFKPGRSAVELPFGMALVAVATLGQYAVGWDWGAWGLQLLGATLFAALAALWLRASRAIRQAELAAGIDIPAGRLSALLWLAVPLPVGTYVLHRRLQATRANDIGSASVNNLPIVRPWIGLALAITFAAVSIYLVWAYRS